MRLPLDQSRIKRMAGPEAYQQGLDGYEAGWVRRLQVNGSQVRASVQAERLFEVQLSVTDRVLDGACDCARSEGVDFCEHCVAAGLALVDEQSTREALAADGDDGQLQAWLRTQSNAFLAEALFESVQRDDVQKAGWQLRRAVAEGEVTAPKLARRINKCLRPKKLKSNAQVAAWVAAAQLELSAVLFALQALTPERALALLDQAFEAFHQLQLASVDKAGRRYVLQSMLEQRLAAELERWQVSETLKAETVLSMLTLGSDRYESFSVDDLLNQPERRNAFYELGLKYWRAQSLSVEQRWQQLASLYEVLSDLALEDSDLLVLCELRADMAETASDYMDLCELYMDAELMTDAGAMLEQAKSMGADATARYQKLEKRVLGQIDKIEAAKQAAADAEAVDAGPASDSPASPEK